MKSRPTIFLSGVSHEFGSFRDAVETQVQKKGCFAENQPGFAPDYRTVEELLRRKLHDADAVIHIVGFRYGSEPIQRPADVPRRSYTQIEFDIAREMQKPVFVFLSTNANVRQDPMLDEKPEHMDAAKLQLAHREAVQRADCLYYFFRDMSELCKLVAEIPPVAAAGFCADVSQIINYAPDELIGRDAELHLLHEAWMKVRRAETPRTYVLTFVALGGEGKTSLVAKWAAELASQGWSGCDAAFAWSFHNQGTREPMAASSDLFLNDALVFFGDATMAGSSANAFDKGRRLCQLVSERRALLILDGLEPLQYAPTSPTPGELKDKAIAALLKGLATFSQGLCLVTTRYAIADLRTYSQTTAPTYEVSRLPMAAGVRLLRSIGVKSGSKVDFESLVKYVDGHALTLQIVGQYLVRAFHGDIRRRDRIDLGKADAKVQRGQGFQAMEAYVSWLEDDSEESRRELAILKLLGLFDRPATADCVAALRQAPAIPGLTEPLVGLAEDDWEFSLTSLRDAKLLTVDRDEGSGLLVAIDTHSLLREYLAQRMRQRHPEAWRAAHKRLFAHLCTTAKAASQPTLEELQPLYQAVAHGCQAEMHQEAHDRVWLERIRQGNAYYSTRVLGAIADDLGAVACFFEVPWRLVSSALAENDQAVVLDTAANSLRALGRLTEAVEPTQAGIEIFLKQRNWPYAAISADNLTGLELMLGEVSKAVANAEQAVIYADRGRHWDGRLYWPNRIASRASHASALLHAGRHSEAQACFREAEAMQRGFQPPYPLLYSGSGFDYCELLLAVAERSMWQMTFRRSALTPSPGSFQEAISPTDVASRNSLRDSSLEACHVVTQRAATTLRWAEREHDFRSEVLDHLTLGCAASCKAIFELCERFVSLQCPNEQMDPEQTERRGILPATFRVARGELDAAVDGLRRVGQLDFLIRGFLPRARLRFFEGTPTGPESAQADLDEAWETAERGPMPLYMADIRLHRARLFFCEATYPWESPQKDLAEARRLIEKHGYWRRKEELEDAEGAIQGEPAM